MKNETWTKQTDAINGCPRQLLGQGPERGFELQLLLDSCLEGLAHPRHVIALAAGHVSLRPKAIAARPAADLPELCAGEVSAAFAIELPGGGEDHAADLKVEAQRDGVGGHQHLIATSIHARRAGALGFSGAVGIVEERGLLLSHLWWQRAIDHAGSSRGISGAEGAWTSN